MVQSLRRDVYLALTPFRYRSSSSAKRAISIRQAHSRIVASNAIESSGDNDAIHCDEICKLRTNDSEQLGSWHKANSDKQTD